MKCSEYVKSKGVKSLTFLSKKTGVPVTTLRDWWQTRPSAFDYMVEGVALSEITSEDVKKETSKNLDKCIRAFGKILSNFEDYEIGFRHGCMFAKGEEVVIR